MENPGLAIEEFVTLYVDRRQGDLALADRHKLEALENVLRDMIDGAHAAPRKIENPTAVAKNRPGPKIAGAKITISKRTVAGSTNQAELAAHAEPELEPSPAAAARASKPEKPKAAIKVSSKDQDKISSVELEQRSDGYTPAVSPLFLNDYYSDDLRLLAKTPNGPVTRIRNADQSSEINLGPEAKLLLGLQEAQVAPAPAIALESSAIQALPVRAPSPPPSAQPERARPSTRTAPKFGPSEPGMAAGRSAQTKLPAMIHLIVGGSKRGDVHDFDPGQDHLQLQSPQGVEQIIMRDVLAIFFQRWEKPFENEGKRLVVTLVNDRDLTGNSPNYSPGVSSMFVIPENKRGQVSVVWIPAWSVKAIRFA
jgi:hypothetical protein